MSRATALWILRVFRQATLAIMVGAGIGALLKKDYLTVFYCFGIWIILIIYDIPKKGNDHEGETNRHGRH